MENPLILTDGLEYNPKMQKWKATAPVVPDGKDTISLHGASGIPIGSHHILFTGGVNRDIFFKAWKRDRKIKEIIKTGDTVKLNNLLKEKYAYFTMKPEDFRFNKEVIAYHTITNTWIKVHDYPYPGPAGAREMAPKHPRADLEEEAVARPPPLATPSPESRPT